ncbi:MAG: DUF2243 domain-containing protein [Snowella sp.]|nr:DUF2243 domain-containing protein [Snowella sp.]
MQQKQNHFPLFVAGSILIGMGFAALFDGIILHKILQWHHLLSSAYPLVNPENIALNLLWDQAFLAAGYVIFVTGLIILFWSVWQGNLINLSPTFFGCLLIGFGKFNLVEGVVNHYILGIHHVKSGQHQAAWDLGFLLINAILASWGWLLFNAEIQASQIHDEPLTVEH